MEKDKKKPKYNEWQTVGFMLRTAWEIREKKVIFIMISLVVLNVGQNLVDIFITPGILAALERRASLGEL
ncbi:MAG: ABC transporter ATP-binding protein, partial [Clostridia bacterium]|nr:ABC transporter ATP-binding protein [Clostridia bacterium]